MQLTFEFLDQEPFSKLIAEESKLRSNRRAEATRNGYAHDWKTFVQWCQTAGLSSLPATIKTLNLFVTDQIFRGYKITTAYRRLQGILDTLRERGCPLDSQADQAKAIIAGAQRMRCEQPRQMVPLSVEQVGQIASKLAEEGTPIALRDRSIVTLGLASALRRSNLSHLALADIQLCAEGVVVYVRKEKQDQTGKGRTIPIPNGTGPVCAVEALKTWLAVRGDKAGPLYTAFDPIKKTVNTRISPNAVWKIIKKNVAKVGLDPTLYGPHSLRAGFVTEALSRGVGEIRVANHTGHKSLDCLRRYYRPRDLFGSAVGL